MHLLYLLFTFLFLNVVKKMSVAGLSFAATPATTGNIFLHVQRPKDMLGAWPCTLDTLMVDPAMQQNQ